MLERHRLTRSLRLALPNAPAPGLLEDIASLIAHRAARERPQLAKTLLEVDFRPGTDRGLREVRTQEGTIARTAPRHRPCCRPTSCSTNTPTSTSSARARS